VAHSKCCQDEQKCEGFSLSSAPGGVYKIRVARSGEGKSGGYRVIVFFRSEERTFYEYGFAKSDRANISRKELKLLKETAKEYFYMSPDQLREWIEQGKFIEL